MAAERYTPQVGLRGVTGERHPHTLARAPLAPSFLPPALSSVALQVKFATMLRGLTPVQPRVALDVPRGRAVHEATVIPGYQVELLPDVPVDKVRGGGVCVQPHDELPVANATIRVLLE